MKLKSNVLEKPFDYPFNKKSQNNDLVWDFNIVRRRERAIEFIQQFRNFLPVYSASVQQLYTSYTIDFTKGMSDSKTKIIILPDPFKHHDTFHSIDDVCIIPTGLVIVPCGDTAKPILKIPFGRSGKDRKYREIPLPNGIPVIIRNRLSSDTPFLPVICKGDLRTIDESTPSLHLHTIVPARLTSRSEFERYSIQQTIYNKLQDIMNSEKFKLRF